MSRLIFMIIIHCSDSDIAAHDDISVIRDWHVQRGFNDVAYHYFIPKNGEIQIGRDEDTMGAGAKGYNSHSIHICLSGRHEFTFLQGLGLNGLLATLKLKYPRAKIIPHNHINKQKTCPNFAHNYIFGGINEIKFYSESVGEETNGCYPETPEEIDHRLDNRRDGGTVETGPA